MKVGKAQNIPKASDDGQLREQDLLAALPARSANREIKVGAFVLVGVLAFLIALFTLTDVGTWRGRYYVTTVIADAGGMRNGDPVQMRGVNIGRVTGFEMVPEGVSVRMEIYNRYPIPEDSRVAVRSAGLLGGVIVDVEPGQSPERAEDDQVLPGTAETDVFSLAEDLGGQAEVVLERASMLLSEQNIGTVGASAEELQNVLIELSGLAASMRQELVPFSASLRRSAASLEGTTASVEGALGGPELARSIANIDSLTARLDEASIELRAASTSIGTIVARMERGEGTLGRLSQDAALYNNINEMVLSLRALITDIQADPRKYINLEVF